MTLTPASPFTNQTLTATPGVSGTSGDGLVYNYSFKVEGATVQSGPSRTLDLSQAGYGDVGQNVSVQVDASGGVATLAPATSSVTVANSEPIIDRRTFTVALNQATALSLEVRDDDADALTYVLAAGTSLPPGLTINGGLITGTPTQAGQFSFDLTISDGRGGQKTSHFIIIVSSAVDGMGPVFTRDPLSSTYTRDQLAALTLTGTIRDVAPAGVTPSGVQRTLFQIRRNSDGYSYSGNTTDGFTSNVNRGYYPGTLSAASADTGETRTFSRALSWLPPLPVGDYTLNVIGQDNAGNFSVIVTDVTIVAAPVAPTSLTATAGDGQVTLLWNAVSGATSYRVYRSTTSGSYDFTDPVAIVTGTGATNTGLTNGTTYHYVVRSVNPVGESPNSDEASAIPRVAFRQLDLQIEALTDPPSPLVGADVYYPDEQTASYSIPDRTKAVFLLRVKNNGNVTDSFRLSGRGDTPGWTVRYFDAPVGGTDVSAMVKGNNYVDMLSAGASRDYRVEVTPAASVAQNASKDVPISIVSENDSAGAIDRVLARAVQTSAPPPPPTPTFRADGAVRAATETAYLGTDIYAANAGTSQTASGTASSSVAAVYNWKITNTGSNADSFRLTLPAPDANWAVHLYDALDGGTDITTPAQSASGYATATLAPQQSVELRLEVQPANGVTGNEATTLTATSAGDTSGNTRDVCLANTIVGSVAARPTVTFSGATRASAGGVDNALHKLNLTLHATDGDANLINTPITLSFENNVGHDYGTTAAPDVRHRAKIYDASDANNPWKESLTLTTDANGDIPITVLSSDVISQPRLIARTTVAGTAATIGGVLCEFAAATSKRGFPDPVVGTYNDWESDDFGWTCNFQDLKNVGDTTTARLYLKFLDNAGVYQPLAGHQVSINFAQLGLGEGAQIYDADEASNYVVFVNNGVESNQVVVTSDGNGIAQVTIKAKAGFSLIRALQFSAVNTSQWEN